MTTTGERLRVLVEIEAIRDELREVRELVEVIAQRRGVYAPSALMPAWLMCSPTTHPMEPSVTFGTTLCSQCGQEVWLSTAGVRTLAEHPECETVCSDCGLAIAGRDDNPHFEITEGAMEEVEKVLGRTGAIQAEAIVGEMNRAARRAAARRRR